MLSASLCAVIMTTVQSLQNLQVNSYKSLLAI